MSADNWTTCPQCRAEWDRNQDKAIQRLAAAYGKVSEEDYTSLKQKTINPTPLGESLREDYELGVIPKEDGTSEFYVIYGCSCKICGFKYSYKFEKKVFPSTK